MYNKLFEYYYLLISMTLNEVDLERIPGDVN